MLKKWQFYLLLLLIAFFGFTLRLINYSSIPPFGETKDEFHYPWAGISLLQTGIPSTWSDLTSYKNYYYLEHWGQNFRIISPWLEKPPLYPIITGSLALLTGENDFGKVRLATIRLIPLFLSFITMIALGLLAAEIFNRQIALLAVSLYATIPTIVLGNRLSLTENLLTPLVLLTLWFFSLTKEELLKSVGPILIGIGCGLAVLTKQTGATLPIAILIALALTKKWRILIIVGLISMAFALIHPLFGLYYDWNLYLNLMKEIRNVEKIGLPEAIFSIFRFPVIGHKEKIFLDGAMLAGFLLLFTAPFWAKFNENRKTVLTLVFPFLYLLLIVLGNGSQTWYGWYLFPLFPFLTVFLAKALYDLWQKPDILKSLFFYMILGSSTVRFVLLIKPEFQNSWQTILGLFLLILVGGLVLQTKYQRLILAAFFAVFIFVNVLVIINLNLIYPSISQPF